jgi:hypothetical protein
MRSLVRVTRVCGILKLKSDSDSRKSYRGQDVRRTRNRRLKMIFVQSVYSSNRMQSKILTLGLLVLASSLCANGETTKDSEKIQLRLLAGSRSYKIYLNVTYSSEFEFLEDKLSCFQNNNRSMEGAKRINFSPHDLLPQPSSSPLNRGRSFRSKTNIYDLEVREEGYMQCSYMGGTLVVSNIAFVRVEGVVFVARLNQNVTLQWLQNTIGGTEFGVRQLATDPQVFHLNFKHTPEKPGPVTDAKILLEAKKLLDEKIKPPVVVEYVRSTIYCPSIEHLKISFTGYGSKYRLDQHSSLECLGNFYFGAYWNEEQLKIILARPQIILRLQNSTFDSTNNIRRFGDSLKKLQFIREIELPIIADKFELLVTDVDGILKGAKKSQNTSNELLANLDSVLANTSLVANFTQQVRENFAARVEDIQKTGSVGILMIDDTMTTDSNETLVPLSLGSNLNNVTSASPKFVH